MDDFADREEDVETGGGDGTNADTHVDVEEEEEDLPTKIESFETTVSIACHVQFHDMHSLMGGVALRRVLGIMKPRRVAVVHAPKLCGVNFGDLLGCSDVSWLLIARSVSSINWWCVGRRSCLCKASVMTCRADWPLLKPLSATLCSTACTFSR